MECIGKIKFHGFASNLVPLRGTPNLPTASFIKQINPIATVSKPLEQCFPRL